MDVIGQEAPARAVPPPSVVLAVVAVLVLLVGVVAAMTVEPDRPAAAPPTGPALTAEVAAGSDGDGVVARGAVQVVVQNERQVRLRLGSLSLTAPGLRVLSVRPAYGRPLGAAESREYVVAYEVASCLALGPAVLRLSWVEDGRPASALTVPLGPQQRFAPCPGPTAEPVTVAVVGGADERAGTGARGSVELVVGNAGAPVRLSSLTAEVPGVGFAADVPPEGVTVGTGGTVAVRLDFTVDDCRLLRRTGRLVLRLVDAGVERELGLTVTTDFEAATLRQVPFDRVLEACPR